MVRLSRPSEVIWRSCNDLALAFSTEPGHGHNYTGEHVDGWAAMVEESVIAWVREPQVPKAELVRLLAAALRRGLILLSAGTYGNVVRVLAPLTADDALLDPGIRGLL